MTSLASLMLVQTCFTYQRAFGGVEASRNYYTPSCSVSSAGNILLSDHNPRDSFHICSCLIVILLWHLFLLVLSRPLWSIGTLYPLQSALRLNPFKMRIFLGLLLNNILNITNSSIRLQYMTIVNDEVSPIILYILDQTVFLLTLQKEFSSFLFDCNEGL